MNIPQISLWCLKILSLVLGIRVPLAHVCPQTSAYIPVQSPVVVVAGHWLFGHSNFENICFQLNAKYLPSYFW
ncbi:hypothetical protein BDP27DRAFT_219275 [Rhodocollybia butyracea]|uniref:Secreted protein n=1 Tax=Rhodocollybia butyracea TaxID=206335 RepID=A0A9P5UCG7_9AGAR|nr:hypothetical protein BDP27DRAFT_219275 [Rhodocollybia butyracea]